MKTRPFLVLATVLLLCIGAAHAADPKVLIGKWIEKFPNGNGMVTEFTSHSIQSYPVDSHGVPHDQPKPSEVRYRELGETIGIDFVGGGGGIMAMVQDPTHMVLIFPGMGNHKMTRVAL